MDPASKEVVWQGEPFEDLTAKRGYHDLLSHEGLVYGATYPRSSNRFFVFDPDDRTVLHQNDLDRQFPTQQGPQVFHRTPDGRLFVVFADGTISEIDTDSFEFNDVAKIPEEERETVRNGGVIHDGRVYFPTNTRLLSWGIQ
jgi:hypothetical protein